MVHGFTPMADTDAIRKRMLRHESGTLPATFRDEVGLGFFQCVGTLHGLQTRRIAAVDTMGDSQSVTSKPPQTLHTRSVE